MSCTVDQQHRGFRVGGDAWSEAVSAVDEEGRVLLNEAVLL